MRCRKIKLFQLSASSSSFFFLVGFVDSTSPSQLLLLISSCCQVHPAKKNDQQIPFFFTFTNYMKSFLLDKREFSILQERKRVKCLSLKQQQTRHIIYDSLVQVNDLNYYGIWNRSEFCRRRWWWIQWCWSTCAMTYLIESKYIQEKERKIHLISNSMTSKNDNILHPHTSIISIIIVSSSCQ